MASASVFQLQPRQRPFQEAVDAYRGARAAECLTLLHGHQGLAADLLLARAALRVGRPELGLERLVAIDEAALLSNRARTEVLTLRAALCIRLRQFDLAQASLDLAHVYALGAACAPVEAEYHFYAACQAFALEELDAADRAAVKALSVERWEFDSAKAFVPLALSRARSLNLRGFIAATRQQYRDQLAFVREAIAEAAKAETPDLWITATQWQLLAVHVRDFDLIDDAQTLRVVAGETWPAELDSQKFEIHRALGWSSALRGDHLNAFREFRSMGGFATSDAWKVLAAVERAYLSRELGENVRGRDDIEYAAKLADRVDWNAMSEERIGLAQLAQEVAAFDPPRAGKLLDRYRAIKAKLPPLTLNSVDRRARAYECLAEGTVLRANRAIPAAAERFREAFEIFDSVGYRWRAATAALPLAELFQRPLEVEYVRREAAQRPNSWLERRAANLCTHDALND